MVAVPVADEDLGDDLQSAKRQARKIGLAFAP